MAEEQEQLQASLTDLLDGSGSNSESIDWDALQDDDVRRSVEDALEGKRLLGTLETDVVSSNFERRVRHRIRRRSGGRLFSHHVPPTGFGLTIDAFIVLAVAIMAAGWFLIQEPPAPPDTFFNDPPNEASRTTPAESEGSP